MLKSNFMERGNNEMKEFKVIIVILSLIPFEFLGILRTIKQVYY